MVRYQIFTLSVLTSTLVGQAYSSKPCRPRAPQTASLPSTATPASPISTSTPPPPPTTTPPSTPTTTTTPATTPPCDIVSSLSAVCASRTPAFANILPFASRASCLCYSSTAWAPNIYDLAARSCAPASSDATPAPCRAAGNVAGAHATISAGPEQLATAPFGAVDVLTGSVAPPNTTLVTDADPNRMACTSYSAQRARCSAATPGFPALAFSSQAKCLCVREGAWDADAYDDSAASCLEWYVTAAPGEFSALMAAHNYTLTTRPCHAYTTRALNGSVSVFPLTGNLNGLVVTATPPPSTSSTSSTSSVTTSSVAAASTSSLAASTSTGAASPLSIDAHSFVHLPLLTILLSSLST